MELENIILLPGKNKKVVATSLFIPLEGSKFEYNTFENYVESNMDKIFLYFTGFIKSVSLFRKRLGINWIYRIYLDEMFFDDTSYNAQYNNNASDLAYNKIIKEKVTKNKEKLNIILKLYKDYIKYLIDNKDKYNYIEIIKYRSPAIKRIFNRKYLGYPNTFGSMARFNALFDPDVDMTFLINISTSISPLLAKAIHEWSMAPYSNITYTGVFERKLKGKIDPFFYDMYELGLPKGLRFSAGLTGVKRGGLVANVDEIIKIMTDYTLNKFKEDLTNNETPTNLFQYSYDEVILTSIVDLTKTMVFVDSNRRDFANGVNVESITATLSQKIPLNIKNHMTEYFDNKNLESFKKYMTFLFTLDDRNRKLAFFNVKVKLKTDYPKTIPEYFENIIENLSGYGRNISKSMIKDLKIPVKYDGYSFDILLGNFDEKKPLKVIFSQIPTFDTVTDQKTADEFYYYTMESYYYTYISLYDEECLSKIIKYYEDDNNYDIQPLTVTSELVYKQNIYEKEPELKRKHKNDNRGTKKNNVNIKNNTKKFNNNSFVH